MREVTVMKGRKWNSLYQELSAVAGDELADVLDSWPVWSPEQFSRLSRYLLSELDGYGMLSVEKGRECGSPMGAIRRDARLVLGSRL